MKSSERKRQRRSAGPVWTLGGLAQASLVAGEAGADGLRGAVDEVCQDLSPVTLGCGHAAWHVCSNLNGSDLLLLWCSLCKWVQPG